MDYRPVTIVVLLLILAYFSGALLNSKVIEVTKDRKVYMPTTVWRHVKDSNVTFATIYVPAVDANGEGVITSINVQAYPGAGEIMTNIDKILFWVDTQHSILTARSVAQNTTDINLSNYDLVYTISAEASVIEGPSAGAALTAATIAALKNWTIRQDITLTGTINSDGTIGTAGAVLEKAMAARENNASLFLVPEGSLGDGEVRREKQCQTFDGVEYCEISYLAQKTDISNQTGITVREIKDIEEALDYLIEERTG